MPKLPRLTAKDLIKIIHPRIVKRIFEDIKINPDEVKEEPRIELIEVDDNTQALMDDVVTEWDKR